jgi:LytS/YehU family sensor histidine kinase
MAVAGVAAVLIGMSFAIEYHQLTVAGGTPSFGGALLAEVHPWYLWLAVLAGLAYLTWEHRKLQLERLRSAELHARIVSAELRALRTQLCPHFLFNTLNSACTLITVEPERAELMITRLSQLLRLALQTEGIAEVPLAEEVAFAEAYLAVERIRFQERLQVRVNVPPEVRDALVPSFLLQPIVENAVHHAVAPSRDPRRLELRVVRRSSRLVVEVLDDGPGLQPGALERRREAIGLSTTRARLEHLYPDDFRFEVRNRQEGGAVAEVDLPFHTADGLETAA